MQAYGYDFHQTMIAKIEAAQRPLRVRELADFAALYGVEVHELIYPPTGSLAEIDKEIASLRERREQAQRVTQALTEHLRSAHAALTTVQDHYEANQREVMMLEGRLDFLREQRKKFALWEADEEPAPSDTPA
jgi:hypothetical protein